MEKWEGLGYNPGPVGESHSRVGPPTREAAAAPADAHSAPERQGPGWHGPRAAAAPPKDEEL